jgi:NTP pyrophosphatase (non-canonical NTP hydrolase)
MDIKELAKRIHDFQKERFPKYGSELTSELIFTHAVEEIGEIARQVFNKSSGMRNYNQENLKEEIVQAILDLLTLAELNEIDLEKEIEKKITDMENRWKPKD